MVRLPDKLLSIQIPGCIAGTSPTWRHESRTVQTLTSDTMAKLGAHRLSINSVLDRAA